MTISFNQSVTHLAVPSDNPRTISFEDAQLHYGISQNFVLGGLKAQKLNCSQMLNRNQLEAYIAEQKGARYLERILEQQEAVDICQQLFETLN